MFEPFRLQQATRVSFGADRLGQLGDDVQGVAGPHVRVMVLSDRGVVAAGLVDRALAALAECGLSTTVFAELEGEPHAELIDRAAAAARSSGAAVVVTLGGGSALDVGTMTAAIAPARAAAEDFALCARPMPAGALPIVCVPTTAGTGAEVTATAVFADGNGRKVWAWDEALRPRLALLDPSLTTGLPRSLTAITGLDALAHAIEAASSRRASPFSAAYTLQAIRLIARHLQCAVDHPDDLESRAGMLLGACLAGSGDRPRGHRRRARPGPCPGKRKRAAAWPGGRPGAARGPAVEPRRRARTLS